MLKSVPRVSRMWRRKQWWTIHGMFKWRQRRVGASFSANPFLRWTILRSVGFGPVRFRWVSSMSHCFWATRTFI